MRVEELSGICRGVCAGMASAWVETDVSEEILTVSSMAAVSVQSGVG